MPRRSINLHNTEANTPDARGEAVLAAIIKEHLVTGEAVGSRVLSTRFENAAGWSAATIRNIMGELEDTGLVEQPHTSAGRVPTDKGYRYYVDHMLSEARLSEADLKETQKKKKQQTFFTVHEKPNFRFMYWCTANYETPCLLCLSEI